ncbi:spermatogenesis-associated protein 3 [Suncus etruscus]|uniref:spermatogenesis-associated protein 3 n=1 Tax=Suncus etruscus TaxID=109475 RepID=UPI0021101721|nr:spermatogenesis-associated protein 3 [Suncus etruscus]
MKKSKRKKSEHRRHGSHAHSQPASSESSPRKASSESTTPRSNSGLSPQNPCSVNVSQKPSSEDILQQPSTGAAVQHLNVEVTSQAPSSGVSPQRSRSHQQYLSPEVSTQTSFFSKQPQTNSTQEENMSNGCLDRCGSDVKPAFPSKEAESRTHLDSQVTCTCATCPGSCVCWRRRGLCHSRIFDTLLPEDLPDRGTPSLLTFYRF